MNRPLIWWIGLILFVFGAFGAIVPPENYPGWYAKAWGVTHPYLADGNGTSAGVNAQIWTGRGVKGVGGDTRLELGQPALRQEASDADSRVDGRAQHRTWMLFAAMVGLFLMIMGYLQRDRESDDRRIDRLEQQPTTGSQPEQPTLPLTDSYSTGQQPSRQPLEPLNDDPEPGWWQRLMAPWRNAERERRHARLQPIATPAPLEPIKVNIVVQSDGEEGKVKAKHTLTAELPPMNVHSVTAHLKVGGSDTVTEMDIDVR